MKILKTLLFAIGFGTTAVMVEAAPVRYVQISTNTLTRQTGTAVIAGLNVSTLTFSSNGSSQTVAYPGTSCFNMQFSSVTTSSATSVTTFVPTHLSKSINLTNANNKVKITVSGVMSVNVSSQNAVMTVFAGSARNVGQATPVGLARILSGAPGLLRAGVTTVAMDAPLMTGSTTYTVRIAIDNTGSAVFADGGVGTLILEECTP